jgi:Mlc titration factor MtfA (ptsG expression regulator)
MPFLIITLLALAYIAWLVGAPRWRQLQRRRIRERPFPDAWRDILKRRVPYVRALPADLQLQLKKHIQVFIAEKSFIGCAGQAITDEVRVTIAAQACLLLLNGPDTYYPGLRQILVYPNAFVVQRKHTDGSGVVHEGHDVLSGESWQEGQVILSWHDTVQGAATPDDGQNVVIHEFAHQLDQQTGMANGAPALSRREHYAHWSHVMHEEYGRLQKAIGDQQDTLLNPYGATDPAEFFAVISEAFFEQGKRLAQEHPALYRELAHFYRLNPLSWH